MKKINLGQKDNIHFVGIGGIGMSGLAKIMKNMGFKKFKEVTRIKIKIRLVVPSMGLKYFMDIPIKILKKQQSLLNQLLLKIITLR